MVIFPQRTNKYAHEVNASCRVICDSKSSKELKCILLQDKVVMHEGARGINRSFGHFECLDSKFHYLTTMILHF